ncbi:Rieske 2Fe-2S domain-containing protein [Leptolyngbya sp. FACHB-261]|uniref:aromatic ring-hydroxylating dioxygenase subunit alpha n=1 Tax=Leptolyngbya sp. FACHB-261 TaxID=2692806 RepID=UPI001688CE06|nr:Rieske 2Fe-2S domain-containing protein [Leptolyngbya sp. FACHB-261]MBD2103703.1 aromatic ring-hydroxylating dioxygenase subunit alpha [Leptolyngbya sp. FACHB-261]
MELETIFESQVARNPARKASVNPNYWYPVARSQDLKLGKILSARFWKQPLAVFRDQNGQIHAVDDICPHKGVSLHKGTVKGCHLVCPYHGWEYDGASGHCTAIPYLPEGQKLPRASVRSYPVQERYGLAWIFPGDPALAEQKALIDIPQYGDEDWLDVVLNFRFWAHFSICNENTMDMFHGHLHSNYQAWYGTKLLKLEETSDTVQAHYQVFYNNWLAPLLGLSKWGDKVSSQQVTIQYLYPHICSVVGDVSRVYMLRIPVSDVESHSFSLFFTKVRVPGILKPLKPLIRYLIRRFVLTKFLLQDLDMNENEQSTYQTNPERRYVEINPAVLAMQRVIVRQAEQASEQS